MISLYHARRPDIKPTDFLFTKDILQIFQGACLHVCESDNYRSSQRDDLRVPEVRPFWLMGKAWWRRKHHICHSPRDSSAATARPLADDALHKQFRRKSKIQLTI